MELGAIYSKEKTVFSVFSPIAEEISVILYDNGIEGDAIKKVPMSKADNDNSNTCHPDIFTVVIDGDLNGKYYTYEVKTADGVFESHDPYAKACGVNGHRSMVVDLSTTNPEGFTEEKIPKCDDPMNMVITEVSIADVSSDASAHSKYPGKYKAFTEPQILGYFKELGVTHLQILPSYDFGSIDESRPDLEQYNWGYDPYNYNIPEGSYSTDPFNGAVRIKEYKEMVQAIHEAGIGVIMDVVYNHTYNVFDSCFYKTSGNYFYRMDPEDETKYSDASACGNEIATEKTMVRKYIIDSLCYWASEYHIDGFRFDLMGVIDIETMNLAREALLKINPDIIMYGEGWTGGPGAIPESSRALKLNDKKLPGIGMFSDDIRDVVKGHVFYMDDLGFVNGGKGKEEELKKAIICPAWANTPNQVINYLSCHDNYTLWDRFIVSNSNETTEQRLRMNRLAAGILFTAQGIPFFLNGEEFARTKTAKEGEAPVENSYCSPLSINVISYDRAEKYSDLRDYYKGLISLRKHHKAFRLDTIEQIHKSVHFIDDVPEGVVAYTIETPNENVFVAYNSCKNKISIKLPDNASGNGWNVLADDKHAGSTVLYTIKNQASIPEVSCLIAVSK